MFWEPIIVEGHELKKLRMLVHRLRQEAVNCACDITHTQSKGKLSKKTERTLFDKLNPSSMRKCNTWRKGLMAGTLGGYGKKIQAHES